jgi:uncharacterized membrane protein
MGKRNQSLKIRQMVLLAILTAVILVLQLTGFAIKLPFLGTSVSLVLIPITLGAMILGPAAGAFLGFVFGAEVFIVLGVMGMDTFTSYLFQDNPAATAGICLVKSTLAGYLSGLVFRLLSRKNRIAATFAAAAVTPVINTGVFVLGCLLISNTLGGFMQANGIDGTVVYFLLIGCAGINFLFELTLNLILAPVLGQLWHIAARRFGSGA